MTKHSKQLSNLSPTGGSGNRFGIIQLSDLQFGKNHRFGNPSTIAENLLSDIKKMSGEGEYDFTPLYIVLSGDITESAHAEEFKDAENTMNKILEGLNIDRTNILCVPGNHDVNWNLSEFSQEAGDDQLKLLPYHKFISEITNNSYTFENDNYPRYSGQLKIEDQLKLNLEFLLINSCEKEDNSNHNGYVCPEKLKNTLPSQVPKGYERLKIAILHHRLDTSVRDERSAIENASDIESIIACHKYNIVLSGHVHQALCHEVKDSDGHNIIFAGCGSTGVNQSQRKDGIQNQYCIHVIDLETNEFQSIWRAYSPSKKTEFGLGGWTKDNSYNEEPIKFVLPKIDHALAISPVTMTESTLSNIANKVSDLTDSDAGKKPIDVGTKPSKPVLTNLDKRKISFANLLGGWNENA